MRQEISDNYTNILKEELVLALGCTEPISIAYCAATARKILGEMPDHIEISVSGNMLKNAMGVIIPNTANLRGASAAAILGIVGGKAHRKLEVLEEITDEHISKTNELMSKDFATLKTIDTPVKLYVKVTARKDEHYSTVEIKHTHTNIVRIEKDEKLDFFTKCDDDDFNTPLTTRELLTVSDIYDYAMTVDLDTCLKPYLKMQIDMNYAISIKGLKYDYGLNVGSTLLKHMEGNDIVRKAKAYTAAGSDARMSGSTMPVVTNVGSGNQGITNSVPLIVYAEHKKMSEDQLMRALILSDLIAVHIKTNLGRLSAFCGVVIAGTGAAAGISFLDGGSKSQIEDTIKNILANISGVFCDGAKPSCASKIASSVDAAFQASMLAMDGYSVEPNSGIICGNIEQTIRNIGEIGKHAMNETDQKIIEIMSKISAT
ncbi:L-cysteine desulfidase family protein [Haloplasma contractile]|uniref:UPF0597 protein HLPCO_001012 n=1 Tax=Haloplasma contractile SSD-17B TaxID=1033810 RepID=F7Q0I2_9MOLU|nr:L-serine ammonia-lyase, iron-sulfur-dependent, subunit alpha [Haloplasma contractile]ERJ12672.1 Serine dehydratase alpha chain protein [Haloplasma contractile SSD-17B]